MLPGVCDNPGNWGYWQERGEVKDHEVWSEHSEEYQRQVLYEPIHRETLERGKSGKEIEGQVEGGRPEMGQKGTFRELSQETCPYRTRNGWGRQAEGDFSREGKEGLGGGHSQK